MRARSLSRSLTIISTVAVATTLLPTTSQALTMDYLEKGTTLPQDSYVSYNWKDGSADATVWEPLEKKREYQDKYGNQLEEPYFPKGTVAPTGICLTDGNEAEIDLEISQGADFYQNVEGSVSGKLYAFGDVEEATGRALRQTVRDSLTGVDFSAFDKLVADTYATDASGNVQQLFVWVQDYASFAESPAPDIIKEYPGSYPGYTEANWNIVAKAWKDAKAANKPGYTDEELWSAILQLAYDYANKASMEEYYASFYENIKDDSSDSQEYVYYTTPDYEAELQRQPEESPSEDEPQVPEPTFATWWDDLIHEDSYDPETGESTGVVVTASDAFIALKPQAETAWTDAEATIAKLKADNTKAYAEYEERWKEVNAYFYAQNAAAAEACIAGKDYATPAGTKLPANPKPYVPGSTSPTEDTPTDDTKPGDDTKPSDDTKPGDDTGKTDPAQQQGGQNATDNGSAELDAGAIAGIVIGSLAALIAAIAGVISVVNPALLAGILPL